MQEIIELAKAFGVPTAMSFVIIWALYKDNKEKDKTISILRDKRETDIKEVISVSNAYNRAAVDNSETIKNNTDAMKAMASSFQSLRDEVIKGIK